MTCKTRILKDNEEGILEAAGLLQKGELVAIPTETVYGLAANALDGEAVSNIFKAKGRPQDNPLIVHISNFNELTHLVKKIPETAKKLAKQYWPGPLTMIFHKSSLIPNEVSAGLETVAIRMPSHKSARAIINAVGKPLAAPSANRSGSPSPTSAAHVLADMQGRIAAIVDGGECSVGVESTVLDLTKDVPRLLRPGGITPSMIKKVIGNLVIDPAVIEKLDVDQKVASPGMKYKHYSPRAHVILVKGTSDLYCKFVNEQKGEGIAAMCFDGEENKLNIPFVTYGGRFNYKEQARRVFDALRQLDVIGAQTVYCACPDANDMGLAVYNRLLRAAGFEVITLVR